MNLKNILSQKIEILKKYKSDPRATVNFLIWIETDNSGIGFDLQEAEISFINYFSNKIQFTLLTV